MMSFSTPSLPVESVRKMKPLPTAGTLTDDGVLRSLVVFYVLSCIHVHTHSPKLWPIESKPLLPSQKLIYICKFHCLQAPLESLGAQLFIVGADVREDFILVKVGRYFLVPLGLSVSVASHGAFSLVGGRLKRLSETT